VLSFAAIGTTKFCAADLPITMTAVGLDLNTTLNAGGYHGLDRARDVALSESTRTSHCNSLHEKKPPFADGQVGSVVLAVG
jgi:hypothetical protein